MHTPLSTIGIQKGLTTSRLGRSLYLYDEIDSTNTAAFNLALKGAEEGALVLAESQTKGRGRSGRVWYSPKGFNLYLSLILRPSCSSRYIGWLGLAAAVAIAETIQKKTGLPARVKWPNDIELDRRKAAGILLETRLAGERVEFVILGIGINLNMSEPDLAPELRLTATSLKIQLGRDLDRVEFLCGLLASLETWYRIFLQSAYKEIERRYQSLFDRLGKPVAVQESTGLIQGTAVGLTSEGGLLIRRPDGEEKAISAGELIHLRD